MQKPLLYTMDEAAEMLRIKRRRLQMLLHDYPFYRMIGRRKLFTHGDIEKIIEALPRPGELRTMKSARGFDRLPPSEAKLWERVREQMTPPPRKRKAGHQKKPQARGGVVNLA